jgi:hypothetical protein
MWKKIVNINLIVLLVLTTTGFTISKHYCGSRLVSVAVNTEADPCCDDEKGPCCQDESQLFRLQEDFINVLNHLNFRNDSIIDLHFILNPLFNTHTTRVDNTNNFIVFTTYSPPHKIQTVLAKLQTYLL